MKTENTFTPVMIVCPECKFLQAAIFEETLVWPIYIHHCTECDVIISESEWKEIEPFKIEKP